MYEAQIKIHWEVKTFSDERSVFHLKSHRLVETYPDMSTKLRILLEFHVQFNQTEEQYNPSGTL